QQQRVVVTREEIGVGRRRREQEQSDRRDRREPERHPAQAARREQARHGVNANRCQSELNCHSREASALTWNGFGSWSTSSLSRTAASYRTPFVTSSAWTTARDPTWPMKRCMSPSDSNVCPSGPLATRYWRVSELYDTR